MKIVKCVVNCYSFCLLTQLFSTCIALPPKWKIKPSDQSVVVGQSVTFNCQANGYPSPIILWKVATDMNGEFKSISSNYRIQTHENGSLTIKEAFESDSGFYLCEAGNSVGVDLSKVAKLSVHIPALFKTNFQMNAFRKSKRSETSNELPDQVSSVRCEALNSKAIRIQWNAPKNNENAVLGYYIGRRVNQSDEPYFYSTVDANSDKPLEFIMKNLKYSTSYTIRVQAFNREGAGPSAAEVSCRTLDSSPAAAKVELMSVMSTSAKLKWNIDEEANSVSGFRLFLRQERNDWRLVDTLHDTNVRSYTFKSLKCATRYETYLVVFNEIGDGDRSDLITFRTQGLVHVPDKLSLLSVNSTFVVLHLDSWRSYSCPIDYFVIQYKQQGHKEWILSSNSVSSFIGNYLLVGLQPATGYDLMISAHGDGGNTQVQYSFATLAENRGTIDPQSMSTTIEDDLQIFKISSLLLFLI